MRKAIREEFRRQFGTESDPIIVRSPGRVNIIGEHTDYNEGFVLPAAIDKAAYIALSPRDDREIHLYAADLNESFSIALDSLRPIGDTSWPNYILGVVAQFRKAGIATGGFNAVLTSDVPIGAGLSSSAAVECATAFALNEFTGAGLDRMTMIKMAQKAEHEYAGVMCGIMDMFASMMGRCGHVIKLDCRTLGFEYVPFNLEGIRIVLLNTNVKHSLASSEYNTRRQECQQAVDWVNQHHTNVHSLRDVTEPMLDKYVLPRDPLVDRRSRFIVQEIQRLEAACEDLKAGQIEALGKKMFQTHDGLSQKYEVSCRELDFLVDSVRNHPSVVGARMMGGGFGGCTINLVRENAIDELVSNLSESYQREMGLPLTAYTASIENGTSLAD